MRDNIAYASRADDLHHDYQAGGLQNGAGRWVARTCRMTAGEHCSVYASYSLCLSFQKRTWNSSCTAVRCSFNGAACAFHACTGAQPARKGIGRGPGDIAGRSTLRLSCQALSVCLQRCLGQEPAIGHATSFARLRRTMGMKSRLSTASYMELSSSTAKRWSSSLRGNRTGSGCVGVTSSPHAPSKTPAARAPWQTSHSKPASVHAC